MRRVPPWPLFALHGPLFALTVLAGCAAAPASVKQPVKRIEMEPMRLVADRGEVVAYDADSLFQQAVLDLRAGRFTEAAAGFDRLLGELPGSAKEAMALYNAGLAHKGRKDYEQAAARFARLAQEHPGSKDVPDALFHLGACQAELARWQESLATFDRLLLRQDLDLSDRVEAMSRRGVALLELGRLEEAERAFRQTMAFFRENEATERLDSDYYLALSQFQLGEIARRYFQALPLRLPQLEQDIEAKARMFLTAQARYLDTVRLKNPTWATAAGYQIGALYRELYEMLVSAPLPKEVDTDEAREVYLDLTRRRLRVLLSRARHIHEKNLEMAGRVGVDNGWVERSSAQLRELSDLLASLPQAE